MDRWVLPRPTLIVEDQKRLKFLKEHFAETKKNLLEKMSKAFPKYDPSTTGLPIEIFSNLSHGDRRRLFFSNLGKFQLLILEVIEDNPKNKFYKLKVISKVHCLRKLDDLDLQVWLPKYRNEMELMMDPFPKNKDLLQAAVVGCIPSERKLLVTVRKELLPANSNAYLGKITKDSLPKFVGYKGYYKSLADYLKSNPESYNPECAKNAMDKFGHDHLRLYSFFDEWDGKDWDRGKFTKNFVLERVIAHSNSLLEKGIELRRAGQIDEALDIFSQAIQKNPRNFKARIERGEILKKKKDYREATVDLQDAIDIDPSNQRARRHLSEIMTSGGKMHEKQKDIKAAIQAYKAAVQVDENNMLAQYRLTNLQKLEEEGDDDRPNNPSKYRKRCGIKLSMSEIMKLDNHEAKCALFLGTIGHKHSSSSSSSSSSRSKRHKHHHRRHHHHHKH